MKNAKKSNWKRNTTQRNVNIQLTNAIVAYKK